MKKKKKKCWRKNVENTEKQRIKQKNEKITNESLSKYSADIGDGREKGGGVMQKFATKKNLNGTPLSPFFPGVFNTHPPQKNLQL